MGSTVANQERVREAGSGARGPRWLALALALALTAAVPLLALRGAGRRPPPDGDAAALVALERLAAAARPAPPPVGRLRVLFIGNSLTRVNDLPATIAYLAAASGQPPMEWQAEVVDGAALWRHARERRADLRIRCGGWSHVVIQDHSTAALAFPAALDRHGRAFIAAAAAVGARPLLYQTWARRDHPGDQDAISAAYAALASAHGTVALAPVGEAFRRALAGTPRPELHLWDGLHPTAAGTYLAACVFHAVLGGRSPLGLPAAPPHFDAPLPPDIARVLQQAAHDATRAVGPAPP